MYQPKSIYTKLALDTLQAYLTTKDISEIKQQKKPKDLLKKRACFVSLHIAKNDQLRGCIGTIEPYKENLFEEIISNAIAAATRDSRFPPLTAPELDEISISVDVLSEPKAIESLDELNPTEKGIIISDGFYRKGVLLPNLESITTPEKQLEIASRKAGIYENDYSKLDIYTFTATRYH